MFQGREVLKHHNASLQCLKAANRTTSDIAIPSSLLQSQSEQLQTCPLSSQCLQNCYPAYLRLQGSADGLHDGRYHGQDACSIYYLSANAILSVLNSIMTYDFEHSL